LASLCPLHLRFDWGVDAERRGDGGMLGAELEGASPLMISWIEASSASTRCDICTTVRACDISNEKQLKQRDGQRTAIDDLRGHIVEFRIELLEQRFHL